jgi:signal peptidase I
MSQAVTLAATLAIGAGLAVVVVQRLTLVRVRGHSMLPTLRDGDRFLAVQGVPPWLIRRGRVVMGDLPDRHKPIALDPAHVEVLPPPGIDPSAWAPPPFSGLPYRSTGRFVKRVVGRPGDRVTISLDELLRSPEGYRLPADDLAPFEPGEDGTATWTVPDGHFFVRADGWGGDSTQWGPIPAASIRAVSIRRFLAPTREGRHPAGAGRHWPP